MFQTLLVLCRENQWCLYAIFSKDCDMINKPFLVYSHTMHANLASSLDRWINIYGQLTH